MRCTTSRKKKERKRSKSGGKRSKDSAVYRPSFPSLPIFHDDVSPFSPTRLSLHLFSLFSLSLPPTQPRGPLARSAPF